MLQRIHRDVSLAWFFPWSSAKSRYKRSAPGPLLAAVQRPDRLLGFLGARFRDPDPHVQAVMPIMLFISPVPFHSHQLALWLTQTKGARLAFRV